MDHDWTYNSVNEITQYINSIDGTADYTSNDTSQLTGADYNYQTDESYTYVGVTTPAESKNRSLI